jgi:outer membrane lipoprotein-sorting protein
MIGHSLPTLEKMPYNPTMPNIRLILAIGLGLIFPIEAMAQNPGDATAKTAGAGAGQGGIPVPGVVKEEPPTPAEEILDKAIARLKKITSFSADIAQTVDMLNQKFEIKGNYLKASNYRLYLKLTVSGVGDTPATTLQVCDGTTLWEFRQVLDSQLYTKLTIPSIMKKLNDPVLEGSPIRDTITTRIGFAGPEAMLAGLRRAVLFDQKAEETLDGKKVWVIRGKWRDRAGLVGPGQQPPSATAPLPPYIPSNVSIWIRQDDNWPVKIEMAGNALSMLAQGDLRRIGPDGRPIGPKIPPPKVDPSRIILVYKNLKLNPEIEAKAFAFQAPAGAANVQDETETLLTVLDKVIQEETLRKKSESAKSDSVLPGAIEVPSTDSGPAAPFGGPTSPAPAPSAVKSPADRAK